MQVVFTVKDAFFGNRSLVDIKLRTLLGAKYLAIDSIGTEAQDPSQTIGEKRTTSPFDVYPAFTKLTKTVQDINTKQLAKSFDVLSQDFSGTPKSVGPVVRGLSRLSETISSRDQQLQTLLSRANDVTGVLAARDSDLQQLLSDGNKLLAELHQRRDAIHSLLINTQVLSKQLVGLVHDNQKTLKPLLNNVDELLTTLENNQDSLDRGLALLGPFYRVFNNVIGNGRWFDNYIQNFNGGGVVSLLTGQVGGRTDGRHPQEPQPHRGDRRRRCRRGRRRVLLHPPRHQDGGHGPLHRRGRRLPRHAGAAARGGRGHR